MTRTMVHDDNIELGIAIVGMAGRFPGAPSVEALWSLLSEGREGIRDLSDDELRAGGSGALLADARLVRRAADLPGADLFDAGLFGFTPREAEITDPQFRIFLEDAWTALEDAGRHRERAAERTGVFAGGSPETYLLHNVLANPRASRAVGEFQTSLGNQRDYLATQVSYRLDLRGPSLTVQTACSTSLVAVHLACQSLLARECDVALAGGVSIVVPQTSGYLYEEGGIASPDGRCRAFDADAAGCIKGNGSGVVVLRRLEDALLDGDRIRAVIRGSAMNNDGSGKVGFTAPSEEGQAAVVVEALAAAGVDPGSISYIEAHGTATSLGDPIEVAALTRAFAAAAESARCAIGSIKSNIGHLDAAAGVAGLIKTVLMLEHREMVPSLHYGTPNPRIDFARSPFRVADERRPWVAVDVPRRAGVSSFGIGGTNAHVVLEEAPAAASAPTAASAPASADGEGNGPALLVVSAASEQALAAVSTALASRLEGKDAPSLTDAAFTTQTGRRRLRWRRAIVASSRTQTIADLRAGAGRYQAVIDERRGAEVAFVFPGQGAQRPGMARALHDGEAVFREAFSACSAAMRAELGCDLADILYPRAIAGTGAADPGAADPSGSVASPAGSLEVETLRDTLLAQPALFAVEYALARLMISWGVRPSAVVGHSVGEYVAACIAGVMTLEDAAALVAARARLMSGMARGAMLATTLSESDLKSRLASFPALSLAAVNGPAATVASGPEPEIARLEAALASEGIAAKRLVVSHAFHSAMMEPVLRPFEERVRAARLRAPSIPMLSNLTGTWITAALATDPGYWSAHLRGTVRFADNLAALTEDSSRVLLELGPGSAMTALARRAARTSTAVATMAHVEDAAAAATDLLDALGGLWRAGVEVDWEAVHGGRRVRRVNLPTYPFERARYWIDPRGADGGRESESAGPPAKDPDLSRWFYVPGWKRSVAHAAATASPEPTWLVLSDGSAPAQAVSDLAAARGARVAVVRAGGSYARQGDAFTVDPSRREHFVTLLHELKQEDALPGRVVHLWPARPGDVPGDPRASAGPGSGSGPGSVPVGETEDGTRVFWPLLYLLQAFGSAGIGAGVRIVAVANGVFDVAGETPLGPDRALLVGICRVAVQEYPGLICRLADLTPSASATDSLPPQGLGASAAGTARRIAAELDAVDREPVVAWRGGHRWVPSHTRVPLEAATEAPPGVRAGGVYVLTGGTGPIEMAIAARLAASGAKAILFLESGGSAPAGALAAFAEKGVTVELSEARVTDPRSLTSILGAWRSRFGSLDVVFHTSGDIGGGMIQLKERDAASRILAPRVTGSPALAGALREGERLVLFSSAISATGVFGQVDFCAASAYLDAVAQAVGGSGPSVLAIDWGTAHWDRWSGAGGEALQAQLREMQETVGITVEEGVEALWRALALGERQVVVSPQPFEDLVAEATSSSMTELLESMRAGGAAPAQRDGRAIVPVSTEIERRVAGLWSDLLGIAPIGRQDNFFDLGGNSLLAIQLASQLRSGFDIELTIASLFESADLAALASVVDAALAERREADEVARLLAEIEGLSEDEVRRELAETAAAEETPASSQASGTAADAPTESAA